MSDYYCPNCGADLGDQAGFDPDEGFWKCLQCGEELYGDDSVDDCSNQFSGVVWRCDGCGAVLNNQSGFDDWMSTFTCEKCGTLNFINESEIEGNSSNTDDDEDRSALGAIASFLDSAASLADTIIEIKKHRSGEDDDDEAAAGEEDEDEEEEEEEEEADESSTEDVEQSRTVKHEKPSRSGPSLKTILLSLAVTVLLVACMVACPDEALELLKALNSTFMALFNLLAKAFSAFFAWLPTLFVQ